MSTGITKTTCGYCSTGCELSVETVPGLPPRVSADSTYPVNLGKACPKGFQFLGHLNAPNRAVSPYLRERGGNLVPIDWERALEVFTRKFKDIQKRFGEESVAFISTGQITNEEMAFLGALAKFGMRLVHGDGNTRQCMATAVVAYKESFGFDAPPATYKDLEESDVLVFIGSNPAIAHPVMWNRVKMNRRQPRIIVIDPRKTETASYPGALHFNLKPKSDMSLLYGLARILIEKGWINQDYIQKHTQGFIDFKNHVQDFDLSRVVLATGLSPEQIENLASIIHQGERVSFWWMVGINQGYQAVRTAQAIINLALLTGNIGRPGTGANSITGQSNAMGSRLFSNTTSLFCGRDYALASDRPEVANILKIDPGLIPPKRSLSYDLILDEVESGRIKGFWIICTNPIHSWIDRNHLKRILPKAEFVVVQDMFFDTQTAQYADLILPAAGCGEKDGTFINTERRIGMVRKVAAPPGLALPDFEIFQKVAASWGCADLFREWTSPEAVFHILRRLSQGRPCDFSGIHDYRMLEELGGIQWPLPEAGGPPEKERRLFESGTFFHADGRARFVFEAISEAPEIPDAEYPFILLTGRGSISQWHTLTRTDQAPILKKMSPDPAYVEINPEDAQKLGISAGDWVEVSSRRGRARARAKLSGGLQPGQLFMPMHYDQTNNLTFPAFDSYSRQPSYKYAAVQLKPSP